MDELKNNDKLNDDKKLNSNSENEKGLIDIEDKFLSKIKSSFTNRKFKSGAFVSIISVAVVIIVIVFNLIISEFDLNFDMSQQDLYTLSDNTVDLIKDLEDDVTLYYLIESGNENTLFQKVAQEYETKSKHIKLEYKDPTLYPRFAYEYIEEDVTISQNSFLVVNNNTKRAEYIDYNELLIKEFSYETYNYYTTGIDAEGQITAALQYVTEPNLPMVYVTTGHNEMETGEYLADILDKQNVKVESLVTLTIDSIPKDCDILFINAPTSDFTQEETDLIKEYMAGGGDVVIVVDSYVYNLNNLTSLLDYYGIFINEGIVYEGDTGRIALNNYPTFIAPYIRDHDIMEKIIEKKLHVLTPESSGLSIKETTRSSLTTETILMTSDKAYSKIKANPETFDKEEGDIDGPFYIGVISTDTYEGVTSNMVVYSSAYIFRDDFLQKYGNLDLLTGTVGFLSDKAASISVKERSLIPDMVYINQKQANFIGLCVILIVPALVLTTGIIIIVKRRKK